MFELAMYTTVPYMLSYFRENYMRAIKQLYIEECMHFKIISCASTWNVHYHAVDFGARMLW